CARGAPFYYDYDWFAYW
nr:immunoglobulin heavy chain junction region [Mus musculus]